MPNFDILIIIRDDNELAQSFFLPAYEDISVVFYQIGLFPYAYTRMFNPATCASGKSEVGVEHRTQGVGIKPTHVPVSTQVD